MQVQFDEQAFIFNRYGGIRRYFTELIPALRESTEVSVGLSFRFTLPGDGHRLAGTTGIPGPDRPGRRAAFASNTPYRRREDRGDVIHRTYYHPRFVRRKSRVPVIYSVFDFIPERFPEEFPGGAPHLAKPEAFRGASGLLCISEFAQSELLDFYPSLDVPVTVAPLGVGDWWFEMNKLDSESSQRPTILFVGRRDGYKDFTVAAEAFALTGLSEHSLVIAGGGDLSLDERRLIAHLGISDQVSVQRPTDGELRDLYASADAFLFPSRMEGFGLPTLEALAAGNPAVILADTPISREVGGEAVRYASVGSSDEFAEAMLTAAAQSKEDRRRNVDIGRKHASRFTWAHTAQATANAYATVLDTAR